jgi:hypothetical protein
VEDLSDFRDRGPEFKTGSRPLTFTKAVTEFSEPYTLWGSHALTNSIEFRHEKDVKTLDKSYELTELDRLISQVGIKGTLNEF